MRDSLGPIFVAFSRGRLPWKVVVEVFGSVYAIIWKKGQSPFNLETRVLYL
jgi:hypothetical protein